MNKKVAELTVEELKEIIRKVLREEKPVQHTQYFSLPKETKFNENWMNQPYCLSENDVNDIRK